MIHTYMHVCISNMHHHKYYNFKKWTLCLSRPSCLFDHTYWCPAGTQTCVWNYCPRWNAILPFFLNLNQWSLYFVPFLFRMQCLTVKCHREKECFKNEVLIMSYGPDSKFREELTCYFSSQELILECVKMLFIFRQATRAWHHVNPKCL